MNKYINLSAKDWKVYDGGKDITSTLSDKEKFEIMTEELVKQLFAYARSEGGDTVEIDLYTQVKMIIGITWDPSTARDLLPVFDARSEDIPELIFHPDRITVCNTRQPKNRFPIPKYMGEVMQETIDFVNGIRDSLPPSSIPGFIETPVSLILKNTKIPGLTADDLERVFEGLEQPGMPPMMFVKWDNFYVTDELKVRHYGSLNHI